MKRVIFVPLQRSHCRENVVNSASASAAVRKTTTPTITCTAFGNSDGIQPVFPCGARGGRVRVSGRVYRLAR